MAKNKQKTEVSASKSNNSDNDRYLKYAFYTLVLIVLITLIGANDFNLNAESKLQDVSGDKLFTDNYAKIPIKTLHINNDYFLPRSYIINRHTACLYNSEFKKSEYLNLIIDDKEFYEPEIVEIGAYKTKDVNFFVTNTLPRKAPAPYHVESTKIVVDVNMPIQEVNVDFDKILIISNDRDRADYSFNDYVDCYSLSEEQINDAEKVNIV